MTFLAASPSNLLVIPCVLFSGVVPLSFPLVAQEEERLPGLDLVVTINGRLGKTPTFGAGIIFARETGRLYIATANHLVRDGGAEAAALEVRLEPFRDQKLSAKLLPRFDRDLDVAVLTVESGGIDTCSLSLDSLGPPAATRRGHFVLPVGNAQGVPWAVPVEPDRVVDVSRTQIVFQSTYIARGHAGGAVLNVKGELIGMIQADQPPYGRAIDIYHLSTLLAGWNYPVHITARGPGGESPLTRAAQEGDVETAKRLLAQPCANVNLKGVRGRTPLHQAAAAGQLQIVDLFLNAGADANAEDSRGGTPLSYAAQRGNGPIIEALIARGANANRKLPDGTALCTAAGAASPEAVTALLKHGADPNATCNQYEPTPLFLAAGRSSSEPGRNAASDEVVGVLARAGANVNTRNVKGETPLALAVGRKRLEAVKYLIEAGASPDVKTASGASPLRDLSRFWSSSSPDVQAVREMERLILQASSKVDSEDGRELLEQCSREGWPDIASLLLKRGVDVRGAAGYAALKTAAGNRRTEVLEVLLSGGADPNAGTAPTPLQEALTAGTQSKVNPEDRLAAVKLLVARGAKVNISPQAGAAYLNVDEPLYLALVHLDPPDLKVAEVLIARGAVATDTLVNATRMGRPEVIALVRKAGAPRARPTK